MKKHISIIIILIAVIPILCWGQEDEAVTKKLEEKYGFVCYHSRSYGGYYSVNLKSYGVKGQEGACDLKGNEIISPIWDEVICGSTYCMVKRNGLKGVRDWSNREIIATDKYDDILFHLLDKGQPFCDVKINGKVGVYDITKKEEIIPCKYDEIYSSQLLKGTVCEVKVNGKSGVYDVIKHGEIIPCKYDDISGSQLNEGSSVCDVEINGKVGVYDIVKQKEIIPCKYDEIYSSQLLKGTVCEVKVNGKSGVYDVIKYGEIIPCKYDEIHLTDKPYLIVVKGNKYGVIDRNGNNIISANEYGNIYFGYKNKQVVVAFVEIGTIVQQCYFDKNDNFHETEYIRRGKCGVVDLSTGTRIIPCKYDDIALSDEGLYTFNIGGEKPRIIKESTTAVGGKWGVVDSNNKIVIPAEYDYPIIFKEGVAQVSKNGVSSLLPHPSNGSALFLANGTTSSDIDSKIPQTNKKNNETFAFIIANENYANFTGADFSINDGKIFAEYCKKTLGLPEHNVRYFEDATYGNLVSAIKKVEDIASVYEGDATIIFYYSGLGTVDNQNRERYILPTDASINTLGTTGYRVQKLIEQLNAIKTKITLALLDAPFTGMDKNGVPLVKSRSVRISPKQNTTGGTTVVCFSNSNNENSYASTKYGHGLFTYSLLKKLYETKGDCSWKELLESVSETVKKVSLSEFDKVQTPLLIAPELNRNILNNTF